MLKLCPTPTLLELIQVCHEAPEDEREQYKAFNGEKFDPQRIAAQLSLAPGLSWVLYDETHPIAAAGFERVRKGVYQDWMVSTPAAWNIHNWRGTTRYVRRVMDEMLKSDAHRLQCISLRSRIQAHKWYHTLGLRQEGVLEAYGVDGEDALIFARVRDTK